MGNFDIKRIQAPDLTQSKYGQNIRQQFENIDDNFRKLANKDFQKGDTGTSIFTATFPLTVITGTNKYFTKDGVLAFNAILQNVFDAANITIKPSTIFDPDSAPISMEVVKDKLEEFPVLRSINGLSMVDYFDLETTADHSVLMTGIYSYDPVIGHDSDILIGVTNNIVYRDARFVQLTSSLDEGQLKQYSQLIDASGTLYCTIGDHGEHKYTILQNFPTLYYNSDEDIKAFCWDFAGAKTGIIATGPQGEDGQSGAIVICSSDDDVKYKGAGVYEITRYRGIDAGADLPYFNITKDNPKFDIKSGTNCIMFLSPDINSDGISNHVLEDINDYYMWAFIGPAFRDDSNHIMIYCSADNCLQDNLTVNKFRSFLDLISADNADANIRGLYIPYKTFENDGFMHMLYAKQSRSAGADSEFADELHLAPVVYDTVGRTPEDTATKPSDANQNMKDAFIVDYNTTLIQGRLGVGDLSLGNANHRPHKFHVDGTSLFDGEVHIQGHGDPCKEESSEVKSNKNAHLFIGGRAGDAALYPGYVAIQSNSADKGSLYVDSIYPYKVSDKTLSRPDVPNNPLTLFGGPSELVRIGDRLNQSALNVSSWVYCKDLLEVGTSDQVPNSDGTGMINYKIRLVNSHPSLSEIRIPGNTITGSGSVNFYEGNTNDTDTPAASITTIGSKVLKIETGYDANEKQGHVLFNADHLLIHDCSIGDESVFSNGIVEGVRNIWKKNTFEKNIAWSEGLQLTETDYDAFTTRYKNPPSRNSICKRGKITLEAGSLTVDSYRQVQVEKGKGGTVWSVDITIRIEIYATCGGKKYTLYSGSEIIEDYTRTTIGQSKTYGGSVTFAWPVKNIEDIDIPSGSDFDIWVSIDTEPQWDTTGGGCHWGTLPRGTKKVSLQLENGIVKVHQVVSSDLDYINNKCIINSSAIMIGADRHRNLCMFYDGRKSSEWETPANENNSYGFSISCTSKDGKPMLAYITAESLIKAIYGFNPSDKDSTELVENHFISLDDGVIDSISGAMIPPSIIDNINKKNHTINIDNINIGDGDSGDIIQKG